MKPKSAPRIGPEQAGPETSETVKADPEGPRARPAISRILVPIDFSPCSVLALDYAFMLASASDATIILLHVVESAGFQNGSLPTPADRDRQLQPHLRTELERLLHHHRKRIGHRVASETLVRVGRAWSEIPDTAKALGADLIVLGAQGGGCLTTSLLGSTAEGVVRHARCPVLTVSRPAR